MSGVLVRGGCGPFPHDYLEIATLGHRLGVVMLDTVRGCVRQALFGAVLAGPLASQTPAPGSPLGPGRPAVTPEFIAHEVERAQTYLVLMYTLGPTPRTNAGHVAATQQQHLEYLFNLRRAGRLTGQGPILEGGELRGIGFLVGVNEDEARQLAAADPHVKAGYLDAHVFRWIGLPGDSLPPVGPTDVRSPVPGVGPSSGTERPAVTPEFIAREIARAQTYVVRLYTLGPRSRTDPAHLAVTQQHHLEYLFGLRRAGLLTLAGPVLQGPVLEIGELRGIGILVGVDEAQARELAAADPHVEAGYLRAHVFRWMGLPGDSLPHVERIDVNSRP